MILDELYINDKQGEDFCEKVLGSPQRVDQMGRFYTENERSIFLAITNSLLEFANENEYTKDELAAFKTGLGILPTFMKKCKIESEK